MSSNFLGDLTHSSQNWQRVVQKDFMIIWKWGRDAPVSWYTSSQLTRLKAIQFYQRGRMKYCFLTCHVFPLKTLAAGGAGCMSISWSVIWLPLVVFILPEPIPPSAKNMACCYNHRWYGRQSLNLWICAVQSGHTRRCSLINCYI